MENRGTRRGALALALLLIATTGCLRVREGASAPIARAQIADTPIATIVATDTPASSTVVATDTPTSSSLVATETPTAAAPPASPTDGALPAPSATAADAAAVINFNGGGGGNNKIQVVNKTSGRLRVEGRVDYGHAKGTKVSPDNSAIAYASCA